MQQLMYRLVARMLTDAGSLSRNKNFEAFDDPRLKRATRILRHLRALQSDLLVYGPQGRVTLTPDPDGRGHRLEIDQSEVRSQRVAHLNNDELQLLRLHPEVNAILSELLKE